MKMAIRDIDAVNILSYSVQRPPTPVLVPIGLKASARKYATYYDVRHKALNSVLLPEARRVATMATHRIRIAINTMICYAQTIRISVIQHIG